MGAQNISLAILILIIITLGFVQQTSKSCSYVFKSPDPKILTKYFPTFSGVSRNGTGLGGSSDVEPVNDKVNEQYRPNPNYERKEGMGDVTRGLWMSRSSQPGKSNDGRVIVDNHIATDMITPEFCNQVAEKCNTLAQMATTKSRMEDFAFESPNREHPWSY
jgi:hypothetical protein